MHNNKSLICCGVKFSNHNTFRIHQQRSICKMNNTNNKRSNDECIATDPLSKSPSGKKPKQYISSNDSTSDIVDEEHMEDKDEVLINIIESMQKIKAMAESTIVQAIQNNKMLLDTDVRAKTVKKYKVSYIRIYNLQIYFT